MNPILYLCAAVAVIAGFCWAVAKFTDDTVTVEPATRATFDATELCDVSCCPREWQHETVGWRECHLHYYERTEAAS